MSRGFLSGLLAASRGGGAGLVALVSNLFISPASFVLFCGMVGLLARGGGGCLLGEAGGFFASEGAGLLLGGVGEPEGERPAGLRSEGLMEKAGAPPGGAEGGGISRVGEKQSKEARR